METSIRQAHAANILRDLIAEASDESRPAGAREQTMEIAAAYAWALYSDIERSGGKRPLSPAMEARSGVPGDPGYFENLDAIKEFLDCLGSLGKPYGVK